MSLYTKAEEAEIERRYNIIIESVLQNRSDVNVDNIRRALEMAKSAHANMRRRTGEPYIYHPLEVAKIVATEIGLGETSVICAILHDVIEDCPEYNIEDIKSSFGKKVAYIVEGLTKIKDGFMIEQVSAQAENIKRLLVTLSDDARVVIIKLADRLHNMRTMDAMPLPKQKDIAAETLYLYAPLAHRLGLYEIKSELEDLSLKYLEPDIYSSIKKTIDISKDERTAITDEFISPIKKRLTELGFVFTIDSRVKTVYSIYQKMKKKQLPFQEIYDVFAIRIIVDVPEDEDEKIACFSIYSEVTKLYRPQPNRLRDYISIPKQNGYEALHTTVMNNRGEWVEVQIRSVRMNEIAERGMAAHWKYKLGDPNTLFVDGWLNSIREVLTSPNPNSLVFLDVVKRELTPSDIFVYTRTGDVISLPTGSTVLDFAYAVHTNIGNQAIAATVNRNWATLTQELKTGDKIEIITSEKSKPQLSWLNEVKTNRAIKAIKDFYREERKNEIEKGKKLLERRLRKFKYSASTNVVQRFSVYAGYSGIHDLYYDVFLGKVSDDLIHEFYSLKDYKFKTDKAVKKEEMLPEEIYALKDQKKKKLEVDNMDFTVAKCCYPIPGDNIIAYNPESEKWIIHKDSCEEAIFLMSRFADRINHSEWTNAKMNKFLAFVSAIGIDKSGLLADIVNIISKSENVELKGLNINTEENLFKAHIKIQVSSREVLDSLIESLSQIENINEVNRISDFSDTF